MLIYINYIKITSKLQQLYIVTCDFAHRFHKFKKVCRAKSILLPLLSMLKEFPGINNKIFCFPIFFSDYNILPDFFSKLFLEVRRPRRTESTTTGESQLSRGITANMFDENTHLSAFTMAIHNEPAIRRPGGLFVTPGT